MDLNAFIAAIASGKWIVLAALIIGAVVATAKQGWLSAYLAKKLPPAALPYLAVVLGALGMSAAEIVAGKPLGPAIIDGIKAGVLSVFGHEIIVESARSGKEIIPERKAAFLDPPAPKDLPS